MAPIQRDVDGPQHRKPDRLEDRVVDFFCDPDAIGALALQRAPIISRAVQLMSACRMLTLQASVPGQDLPHACMPVPAITWALGLEDHRWMHQCAGMLWP